MLISYFLMQFDGGRLEGYGERPAHALRRRNGDDARIPGLDLRIGGAHRGGHELYVPAHQRRHGFGIGLEYDRFDLARIRAGALHGQRQREVVYAAPGDYAEGHGVGIRLEPRSEILDALDRRIGADRDGGVLHEEVRERREVGEGEGISYYGSRGSFRTGVVSNVIRCKFLGCTMAFRSELVARSLPIPDGIGILHDFWLGAINYMTDGGTLYLDEPLVLYRRHAGAVTAKALSRTTQLHIRANLVRSVVKFWLRQKFRRGSGS